jgi:hypothetical protein
MSDDYFGKYRDNGLGHKVDWAGNDKNGVNWGNNYPGSQWQQNNSNQSGSSSSSNNSNQSYSGGGGGGGGGLLTILVGLALAVFILGPVLLAKLVGFLWGLLLKLGIAGKIITTILMAAVAPLIAAIPVVFAKEELGLSGVMISILLVGLAALASVWYFFWHYDAVKEMGTSVFSNKVKNFAMFVWFGFIGGAFITLFNGKLGVCIGIASCIAGVIYYYLSTKSYGKDVVRDGSFKLRRTFLYIALGLTIAFGVGATIIAKVQDAHLAKTIPAFSLKPPFRARVTRDIVTVTKINRDGVTIRFKGKTYKYKSNLMGNFEPVVESVVVEPVVVEPVVESVVAEPVVEPVENPQENTSTE